MTIPAEPRTEAGRDLADVWPHLAPYILAIEAEALGTGLDVERLLPLLPHFATALRDVDPDATPIGTLEARDRYERWADRLVTTALARLARSRMQALIEENRRLIEERDRLRAELAAQD